MMENQKEDQPSQEFLSMLHNLTEPELQGLIVAAVRTIENLHKYLVEHQSAGKKDTDPAAYCALKFDILTNDGENRCRRKINHITIPDAILLNQEDRNQLKKYLTKE